MKQLVSELYGDYGRYINQYRAFPSILDGAKLVERRLLYSLYEVARERNVKSAKVVGHCIAHYHPHGDTSAYDSLVGLVKNGFAIGQGNWGVNVGVDPSPPAAQRYTEVRASKDILDMYFEFIKYVPYEEVEMDSEPLFLPAKLPLCLLPVTTYCQGMGFGYRTLVPSYRSDDLVKRLRWLLDGKKDKEPVIRPITDCKFLSDDTEFKQLLTTGEAKIEFQGKFKSVDPKTILVESTPPSRSFAVILKKFEKEIQVDKSLGWQDESKTTTRVKFKIIKPRSLKIAKLTKKLKTALSGSVTFQCHVCNTKGKVVLLSVDDMLLNVYKVYRQVVQACLKEQITNLQKSIDELNLIAKLKPLLSIELKSNPDDVDLVIKNIAASLNVTQISIKELFDKYTVGRIFKVKTETDKHQQSKKDLEANLKNLEPYIWKEKYKL